MKIIDMLKGKIKAEKNLSQGESFSGNSNANANGNEAFDNSASAVKIDGCFALNGKNLLQKF